MALLKGDFKPPSQVIAGLPVALDGVFKRAFAQKPEDRFQTTREFASAFREAITDAAAPVLPPLVELADSRVTPAPIAGTISGVEWQPPELAKRPTGWLWGTAAACLLGIGGFVWLAVRSPASNQVVASPSDSAVASPVTASATASALPVQSALLVQSATPESATFATPLPSATASEDRVASAKVKPPAPTRPTSKPPPPFASTSPRVPNKAEVH